MRDVDLLAFEQLTQVTDKQSTVSTFKMLFGRHCL